MRARFYNVGVTGGMKSFLGDGDHGGQHGDSNDGQEGHFEVVADNGQIAKPVADQGDTGPPRIAAIIFASIRWLGDRFMVWVPHVRRGIGQ